MEWTADKDKELRRRFYAREDFALIAGVLHCRVPNVVGRLRDLGLIDRPEQAVRRQTIREREAMRKPGKRWK